MDLPAYPSVQTTDELVETSLLYARRQTSKASILTNPPFAEPGAPQLFPRWPRL
jgi:hypothetical protein